MQVLAGLFSSSEWLRVVVTVGLVAYSERVMLGWLEALLSTAHPTSVSIWIAGTRRAALAVAVGTACMAGLLVISNTKPSRVIEDYVAGGFVSPTLAIVLWAISLLILMLAGAIALYYHRADDDVLLVMPVEVRAALAWLEQGSKAPLVHDLGQRAASVLQAPASARSWDRLGEVLIGAALVGLQRRDDQGPLWMTTIGLGAVRRSWNWGRWADQARVSVASRSWDDRCFALTVACGTVEASWDVTIGADGALVDVRNT
jgi:hypothetical protein